jgi:hypothetical protein
MSYRYCLQCGIVPANHTHGRWAKGGNSKWRTTRNAILTRDGHTCWCGAPATEVHHITDTELRSVCHQHNPRGG